MKVKNVNELNIKIFADGADKEDMLQMYAKPFIKGLTTNPTLVNKSGVKDYRFFCKDILSHIKDKPLSFEVFSDDLKEMERQAIEIASWGDNVYVKIPITNTKRESCFSLVEKLTAQKVKVNVTAIISLDQVKNIAPALNPDVPSYISVFAGRIADTGRNPLPIMSSALATLQSNTNAELIWASPRELLNIYQAEDIGCHIITATNDILKKLKLVGYDLEAFSLDTVRMFYNDAVEAGYKL